MRMILFCVIALVVGVGLSGFKDGKEREGSKKWMMESKKQMCRYFVYTGTTATGEMNCANYVIQSSMPSPTQCPGANIVCWIRVCDVNGDGVVNCTDFYITVSQMDIDGDGRVSDDQLENNTTYAEKF